MSATLPRRRVGPAAFLVLGAAALIAAYAALWSLPAVTPGSVAPVWWMVLVGLFAASIANATGAGGGVVFVPAFTLIAASGGPALTTQEVVALSLLIQCFGMSAGSLSWAWRVQGAPDARATFAALARILAPALGAGLPALWLTQAFVRPDGPTLLLVFKGASLLLGALLLLSTLRRARADEAFELARTNTALLLVGGAAGGVASALFSVGIGEVLALLLLLRGAGLTVSVAAAVIASAVVAIAAAPASFPVAAPHLSVLAATAPGVLIGGWLGRMLALRLGTLSLKRLTGGWIVGSSLALMALSG